MTFQHRAGVRPYTSSCDLAESCVFDKQSLGPFRCDPHALGELSPVTSRGHSFSRSYGVSMPSSLTMVLPIALVCSTRLPVSVLVRAPPRSLEVFLGSMGSPASHEASSNVSAFAQGGFACPAAYALSRGRPEPRPATLLRHPVVKTLSGGTGMSACCASATPVGLALAPD